jgi:hypothetical protein
MSMKSIAIVTAGSWLLLLAACREPNANALYAEAHAVAPAALAAAPAQVAQALPAALCNLEFAGDVAFGADVMPVNAPVAIRGWLGSDDGAPRDPRLLLVDGTGAVAAQYPLTLDRERPDVVRAYPGRDGLQRSGFEVRVDPAALAPQDYHLYLAYDAAGGRHACDNGRRVRVSR